VLRKRLVIQDRPEAAIIEDAREFQQILHRVAGIQEEIKRPV
jgi:hypothetical protein